VIHRNTSGVGPALVAVLTTIASHLAHVNWLGWGGLAVSAGWLLLGYAKHRLERERFAAEAALRRLKDAKLKAAAPAPWSPSLPPGGC
jgi:hypothetical protein